MYEICVFGINYKLSSQEIRERFVVNNGGLPKKLYAIAHIFEEAVILSTCNRTEIYFADSNNRLKERVTDYVKDVFEIKGASLETFYFFTQKEAIEHLFKIASSLDSMVIGEAQILGQVKEAYKVALENKTTGKILNTIFQHSFKVAKRIRTETEIARGNHSVSSIACSLSEEKLGNLADKTVMIIGAGKTGEITLQHLVRRGTKTIFVGNRTFDKAEALAERFGGYAIHFDECFNKITTCDLIISQTHSPHYIIRREDIPAIRKKPLVIIDLALPRDIELEVGLLPDVFLFNIDSLGEVVKKNIKIRKEEITKANVIINEEIKKTGRCLLSTLNLEL